MVYDHTRHLDDGDRREFLKALGVTGAVATGSMTLDDVRNAVSSETATDLAPIGRAIQTDLAGRLDAELLASQQAALASAVRALPAAKERGLPVDAPRTEFGSVADAGRPVYDHLSEIGFFESTTTHLPAFDGEYITDCVRTVITTESLSPSLETLGFAETELVDLVGTVVAHRRRIGDQHWVQTDELPREKMEIGEFIAPMTQNAAGGVLLWLADLDQHLWSQQVILTDDILADAVWEARAMAAGFQLMSEGARVIADGDGSVSDAELGALLSSGFALQAIAQNLLPEDVYWVTEEMRASPRTDLEPADSPY